MQYGQTTSSEIKINDTLHVPQKYNLAANTDIFVCIIILQVS